MVLTPDLCHLDLLSTIKELNKHLILGPSDDGGYWLIDYQAKQSQTSVLPLLILCGAKEMFSKYN